MTAWIILAFVLGSILGFIAGAMLISYGVVVSDMKAKESEK
jgi:branched-subunit amino acid ABC-type transport system permease component